MWSRANVLSKATQFSESLCTAETGKGAKVTQWEQEPAHQPCPSTGAAENLWAEDSSFPWQTVLSQEGRSQAEALFDAGTTSQALAGAQVCCWLWGFLLNYWTPPACARAGCASCGLRPLQKVCPCLRWKANPGNFPPCPAAQQRLGNPHTTAPSSCRWMTSNCCHLGKNILSQCLDLALWSGAIWPWFTHLPSPPGHSRAAGFLPKGAACRSNSSIFPPSWVLVLHQTQTARAGAEQRGGRHFCLTPFCSSCTWNSPVPILDLLGADAVMSQLLLH